MSDQLPNRAATIRLLVVDDDPLHREMISETIKPDGYEVLLAEDGLDALNHLAEPLPDLIITDLQMPRMSGFELVKVVREKFPTLPVIVISSEFGEGELPPHVRADAYLPKAGYTGAQLRAKISELLSAFSNRQQSYPMDIAPA